MDNCIYFTNVSTIADQIGQALIIGVSALAFVSIVMKIAGTQIYAAIGSPIQLAGSMQEIIAILILVTVAVNAKPLSKSVQTVILEGLGSSKGCRLGDYGDGVPDQSLKAVWGGMANMVVKVIVGFSMIMMVIHPLITGLKSQMAVQFSSPNQVYSTVMKGVVVLIFGIITVFSPYIVNEIFAMFN